MTVQTLKEQIARTNDTFRRVGEAWVGKCLICNGRLSFDSRSGFGANIEHIVPRIEGGDDDLLNVALTHPRCNSEKGRNWDNPKVRPRRGDPARYEALVAGFLARRKARWRDTPPDDALRPSRDREQAEWQWRDKR